MADFGLFINKLLRLEGGYVNHPNDKGGCTCKGITLPVFRGVYGAGYSCDDLKEITDSQVEHIYKTQYWDICRADEIRNSQIANLLVDFAVNSGCRTAVKTIQKIVGTTEDGIMGKITLGAINSKSPKQVFDELMQHRIDYYNDIVEKNPNQRVFLKGWLNRLEDWKWKD